MIVYVSEHLFGCDDKLCHFPYGLFRISIANNTCLRKQPTVSKSIEVNLNSLLKKGGRRMLLRRCAMMI